MTRLEGMTKAAGLFPTVSELKLIQKSSYDIVSTASDQLPGEQTHQTDIVGGLLMIVKFSDGERKDAEGVPH